MKKDLIKKIVDTVVNTMFTRAHNVEKVCVDFERASKCGLAASISNCFKYVEMIGNGYKEDIILSYTEYDNAINIYTTIHRDEECKGYCYKFCVRTDKKNQIEVTAELCMALNTTILMCTY